MSDYWVGFIHGTLAWMAFNAVLGLLVFLWFERSDRKKRQHVSKNNKLVNAYIADE
jgi:heme A synthase